MRFSPDGSLVGSVSDDGELIVWDTATGRPLERWDTSDPWGVGFSPDGDLVYGGGGDSMLRTWDLSVEDTYLQRTTQVGDADVFAHADFSPDGQQVAYSWIDGDTGWVRFVDTVTGEATPPARVPVSGGPWASGTWHPQGQKYVAYAYCFHTDCGAGDLPPWSSTPPQAGSSRNGSSSTATSPRSRTSTGTAACSWATAKAGPTSWTPSPCFPRAMASSLPQASHHRRHPDRGREHRDGPRGLRRRHLGALAGDRRQHRRRPVRGGAWTCVRTPRLPLRTARRSRWRGTPARS